MTGRIPVGGLLVGAMVLLGLALGGTASLLLLLLLPPWSAMAPGAALAALPLAAAATASCGLAGGWLGAHLAAQRSVDDGAREGPGPFRRAVGRPAVGLFVLALVPWAFHELVFPWRTHWGDVVLVDRGPLHAGRRFAYDFGELALRDGEVRTWRLPQVPGGGLVLDFLPWQQQLGRGEDGAIEVVVDDGSGPRDFTLRWDSNLDDRAVRARWAAVAVVPRIERQVVVTVRVERAPQVGDGPRVRLQAREHAPE